MKSEWIDKIMNTIKKLGMRAQCYEIIKEKILRQEYDLGEYINIVSLSTELSVSNTPIREALSQLEADGLVISSLNTKAQVVFFTPSSFKDIVQSVYILVKGAYELCVEENRIPELLSMMEKSLKLQEELLIIDDHYQFIKELVHFDQTIFEALENPHLLFLFKRLSNVLFLMYRTNHQRNDWELLRSISEHREIFNTIASGNHSEVEKVIREHYRQSYVEKSQL
ncbi:MAG: GntR family transcriptional regulator [Defluviitaleaceae bacterium]|nr:GntR family transcriptional regulator [Defluviitaleaceae bacterium]